MVMSEFEIVADFKSAANKNKQIGILSQLNNCKPEQIMEILAKNGAITGVKKQETAPKVKRAESTKWTPELDAEVTRLAKEGLKITEIAERLGIKKQAIYDRRNALSKAVGYKKTVADKPKVKNNDTVESAMTHKEDKEKVFDVKAMAKEIKNIFDVCGYDVSYFNIDMLTGTLNISAKEKTAEAATSTVKSRECIV